MLNIRGLKPRPVPSKVPFIRDILYDTSQLFIALTETWLGDHLDAKVDIPGYTLFKQDRLNRKRHKRTRHSGGTALYLNDEDAINTDILLQFLNSVSEVLDIHLKSRNLVIFTVYRQPDDPQGNYYSRSTEFKVLLNHISRTLDTLGTPTPDILICGDFNLPHAVWTNGTCSPGATREEQTMVQDLFHLAMEHSLIQLVDCPTHRAGNTLDLLFSNNAEFLHSHTSSKTTLSNHFLPNFSTVYRDSLPQYSSGNNQKEESRQSSFRNQNFFRELID